MREYTTIAGEAMAEHVEKRSRFISFAAPVADESQAAQILSDIRARYWDAAHNTYAYVLKYGSLARYSDDGEPGGTAGLPILEVLRRRAIFDVIVVVTRYFGGILLGAGGLVRAYAFAATIVLDAAVQVHMRHCTVFSLEIPYSFYGKLQNLLPSFEAAVLNDTFAENVHLTLRVKAKDFPAFQKRLSELTSGQIAPVTLREELSPV